LDIGNPLSGLMQGLEQGRAQSRWEAGNALRQKADARAAASASRQAELHPYNISKLEAERKNLELKTQLREAASARAQQILARGRGPGTGGYTDVPMEPAMQPSPHQLYSGDGMGAPPALVQPGMPEQVAPAGMAVSEPLPYDPSMGMPLDPATGQPMATQAPTMATQGQAQQTGGRVSATEGGGVTPGVNAGFTPEINALNNKMMQLGRDAQTFDDAMMPQEANAKKAEIKTLAAQRDMLIKDQLNRANQERQEERTIAEELRAPSLAAEKLRARSNEERMQTAYDALPKLKVKIDADRTTLAGVMNDVRFAERMIKKYPKMVGGVTSEWIAKIPGTDGKRLQLAFDRIGGYNALSTMMELKAASPTGSTGFGAMNQSELELLKNSRGILNLNMDKDTLADTLNRMRGAYRKMDKGMELNFNTTKQMSKDGKIPQGMFELEKSEIDWSEGQVEKPKPRARPKLKAIKVKPKAKAPTPEEEGRIRYGTGSLAPEGVMP